MSNQTGRDSSFFGVPANTLANLGSQAEGSLSSKGAPKVQQQGVLTTRLAGRVVKVYPNRTMLIEAKKYIVVNGIKREFVLRGIVRPEDIDSSNTVSSDKIANMEIFLDGKGYIAEGGKPGWLVRILRGEDKEHSFHRGKQDKLPAGLRARRWFEWNGGREGNSVYGKRKGRHEVRR